MKKNKTFKIKEVKWPQLRCQIQTISSTPVTSQILAFSCLTYSVFCMLCTSAYVFHFLYKLISRSSDRLISTKC
jgi:hypothetical protein